MKKIRLAFSDFWGELLPEDNYFYNLLKLRYDIIIDQENPDIVIHSIYGNSHLRYDMNKHIKILYLGENYRPDMNNSHYSLSFDYSDDSRNYRLPLWVFSLNWFNRPYNPDRDQAYLHSLEEFLNKKKIEKSKFCSFIVSNPNSSRRIDFARKLAGYKMIDCPGRVFTNVEPIRGRGDQIEKINFLESYKFNLCFENSSHPGYCTEKIIHSMFKNCIPIYWGDPVVYKDFNTNSFLNWHDFNNDDLFLEEIIKLDNDDKYYNEMLNEPWFVDNKIPDFVQPESVLDFFKKIID